MGWAKEQGEKQTRIHKDRLQHRASRNGLKSQSEKQVRSSMRETQRERERHTQRQRERKQETL